MIDKPLTKTIFGVALVILVSRLAGFFREMIIARQFGTSIDYDLYLVAVMLPALAYAIINFAVIYLFVPYLSKHKKIDEQEDYRSIWPAFNITITAAIILTAVICLIAPYIMKIWAGEYSPEQFERIIFFTRITSLMICLGTTEAFMRAYLNVKKIYAYPAGGFIIFNIVSIICILTLAGRLSAGAIAVGLVGGLFIQNIYLISRIISRNPIKNYKLNFIDENTQSFLTAASFIITIELINRSYFLFDRFLAAQFGEGIIAALNYSQVIIQLPESIIGFAIGTVAFPLFSDKINGDSMDSFARIYKKAIAGALLIAIPITLFFYINTHALVELIFQRGLFDYDSVGKTATVLKTYLPSMIALFIITVSLRAGLALGKTKYIFYFSVVAFLIKISGNYYFSEWFGYAGISLATALANLTMALLLFILVVKQLGFDTIRNFILELVSIVGIGLITLVAVLVIEFYMQTFLNPSEPGYLYRKMILTGFSILITYSILALATGQHSLLRGYKK